MADERFVVVVHDWDHFSAKMAGVNTSGQGGPILRVRGKVNEGQLEIEVIKNDASAFGPRPYQVRVCNNPDQELGPGCHALSVVARPRPDGRAMRAVVRLDVSKAVQAFMVSASVQQGDVGYDSNNPRQECWWYSSGWVVVERVDD